MDEKDVKICRMLAINSRISYREIGDSLGLSVNSVHKRVQALMASGVINKFVMTPSLKLMDAVVVMVFGTSKAADMKKTVMALGANQNTYRVVQATGNFLYVHGVLRRISEMEKYISFVRKTGLMDGAEIGIVSPAESMDTKLSSLDYKIINALHTDSRRDLSEISEELGVSTRTVKRRLDRMVELNIVHPSIEFDPSASGSVICLLHLTLAKESDKVKTMAYLKNTYMENLLGLAGVENHPDLLFFTIWTTNMKELRELQDMIEASGHFATAVPHVFYSTHTFDTWMNLEICDKASAGN